MNGRASVIALWLVAIAGLGMGAAGLVVGLGAGQRDVVSRDQLTSAVAGVDSKFGGIEARLAAITADAAGSTPIVNAATLNGLSSDEFVRADAGGTGYFNCQGIGMWPWSSETKYTQTKQGRQVASGEGFFDCLLFLPDGATITALRALVHDLSPTGEIVCYVIAAPINLTTTGNSPAYTESSGVAATPGSAVIEDLSIEPAVVDNTNHSYLAECWISAPGDLALKGVSVEYTTAGRPAP